MADDKPIWSYWLNLAEVGLEEAICLSLDINLEILDEPEERYVRADRIEVMDTFKTYYADWTQLSSRC